MTTAHTSGNQAFGFHYLWEVLDHVISWSKACTARACLIVSTLLEGLTLFSAKHPKLCCSHTPQYPLDKMEKFQRKIPLLCNNYGYSLFRIPKDHIHIYIPEDSSKSQRKPVQ